MPVSSWAAVTRLPSTTSRLHTLGPSWPLSAARLTVEDHRTLLGSAPSTTRTVLALMYSVGLSVDSLTTYSGFRSPRRSPIVMSVGTALIREPSVVRLPSARAYESISYFTPSVGSDCSSATSRPRAVSRWS